MHLGLIAAVQFVERARQLVMHVGKVAMIGQRALESGDGQHKLTRFGKHATQIRSGLDIILIDLDRHIVPLASRCLLAHAIKQLGKQEIRLGFGSGRC